MTPPQPPKRQPSRPDLLDSLLDQQPERDAVRHSGVDGVPQAAPKRSATLPQMAALKAPPIIAQADPRLPDSPGVPLEHQPTLRVPNPLQRQTVRRPTPPSAVAAARRSDAPPAPGPASTGAPDERQAVRSPTPISGPPSGSLPPPSRDPDEAAHRAIRRRAESAEAEAERERQARQRVELELELERERAKRSAPPPKPWIDERLVKALAGLLTALAGLGVPLGIWLTAKATSLESAQEQQAERSKEVSATAGSAKAESSGTDKRLDELEQQLAEERAYNRALLQRMGVEVPKREGDPEPPKLVTETPLPKPGTVSRAPVLVVKTPPP